MGECSTLLICFASGGLRTVHRGKNTLRLSACKGQGEHTYFVALIFPLWEAREVMPPTAEAINAQDFPLILPRVVRSSQRPEAPDCQVKRLRTHRHEELKSLSPVVHGNFPMQLMNA